MVSELPLKGDVEVAHALALNNPGPLMAIEGQCVLGFHHGTCIRGLSLDL